MSDDRPTRWERLLSDTAAAEYLGISPRHFRTLVDEGMFPKPVRLKGAVRWDRDDLDAAINDLKEQEINTVDRALERLKGK